MKEKIKEIIQKNLDANKSNSDSVAKYVYEEGVSL
jgi:hypothetical protein